MSVSETMGLSASHLDEIKVFVAGMECEIESCSGSPAIGIWQPTSDGSLRNNGVEYISSPSTLENLVEAFDQLHKNIKHVNRDQAFSSRTSTHVHVNCRSLHINNVRTLMLLYALYEECFFMMVDSSRRDNIHCVPLTETHLPTLYKGNPKVLVNSQQWSKYTALNLLPLSSLGTVEFRHLQGTRDVQLVKDWLIVLSNLWTVCQTHRVDYKFLSSDEKIEEMFKTLFGHVKMFQNFPVLSSVIKNSLLDVKLSLI